MRRAKLTVSLLIIAIIALLYTPIEAASAAAQLQQSDRSAAETLSKLGIWNGETNAKELSRRMTLGEGAALIAAVQGKTRGISDQHNIMRKSGLPALASKEWLSAEQYAEMLLRALGYSAQSGDYVSGHALDKLPAYGIIDYGQHKRLKEEALTKGNAARLMIQALQSYRKADSRTLAEAAIEKGIIAYSAAQAAGIAGVKPAKYKEPGGIRVSHPILGAINVVIHTRELQYPISSYASLAVQRYDNAQQFDRAAVMLADGTFPFRELLHTSGVSAHPLVMNEAAPNRLYSLPSDYGSETSRYGYLIVFYDLRGNPVGYVQEKVTQSDVSYSSQPVIAVLMYHHFSEQEEQLNSVVVHPDTFRKQLRALREAGFQSIRQQDLLAYLKGGPDAKLPAKSVLITIDDGYESNYKLAYPILLEEKFYASIYVVSSYSGESPLYSRHFSWEEALEMYNSGYIDIQSHTYDSHFYGETATITRPALTHRLLLKGAEQVETKEQYERRIFDDLSLSKRLIEQHVGNEVLSLTYPYGASNDTVIRIASELGHSLMYTVKEGLISKNSNPYLLPRINVHGSYSADQMLKRIRSYQ